MQLLEQHRVVMRGVPAAPRVSALVPISTLPRCILVLSKKIRHFGASSVSLARSSLANSKTFIFFPHGAHGCSGVGIAGYDDVPGNCTGQTVDGCKATCLATSGCGGFNYPHGILKKTSCLSKMGKQGSVDLYVLEATPQPPPPLPKWGELWPIPQNYSFDRSGQLNLAAVFKITTTASSARLARGITRYESIIKTAATPPSGGDFDGVRTGVAVATLPTLTVAVTTHDDDELPTKTTDYSYTLTVTSTPTPSAVVTAASVYGAIYGLETFSQLVQAGGLINASEVKVEDSPTFEHRSFMADTGRRFWPVKTVEALMDGMAANKMNVLHLHLSDNCRCGSSFLPFHSILALPSSRCGLS